MDLVFIAATVPSEALLEYPPHLQTDEVSATVDIVTAPGRAALVAGLDSVDVLAVPAGRVGHRSMSITDELVAYENAQALFNRAS